MDPNENNNLLNNSTVFLFTSANSLGKFLFLLMALWNLYLLAEPTLLFSGSCYFHSLSPL